MIFFSRNKDKGSADLSWLQTDMHSHLLPGIDDGSPDMETSLRLVKGMHGLGYRKLVTTPHILGEMYPNTPDIITQKEKELKAAVSQAGIDIEIKAAAEYFMDEYFVQLLQTKTPLLTIKDNLLLVEFSMVTAPFDLQDMLFELQIQNYQPIIAHPERYAYLSRKKDFFDQLKSSGCLFQLNLLSLTGHYGGSVKELAEYLLKMEYYDYAGTDLHNERHLESLQKLSSPIIKKLKEYGHIKNYEL